MAGKSINVLAVLVLLICWHYFVVLASASGKVPDDFKAARLALILAKALFFETGLAFSAQFGNICLKDNKQTYL